MDPIRNPYSPGAGAQPPALVGRDNEINKFEVAAQRLLIGKHAKSMLLIGLRGVGKTVLLNEFGKAAVYHGYVREHYESSEDTALPAVVAALARKALLKLSAGQRMKSNVRHALGVLKAFSLRLPDGPEFTLDVEAATGRGDSGDLAEDLADLFLEIGAAAQERGKGVLFTIDEAQYIASPDLAALIVALHRVSQESLPVMLTGAGLPSLPGLAGEAKSYAERLFDFVEIGRLRQSDGYRALQDPAQTEGASWAAGALSLALDLTGGYPYFLQEFGKHAWNVAEGPEIKGRDVRDAKPVALAELDSGFFRVRIDRTTDKEREYLRAMAELGPGPYGSGEVAANLGRRTTQLGPVRDTLIKRGLIYSPRWGEVAFTVPMFDEFMRRWMPDWNLIPSKPRSESRIPPASELR
jgi:hypothetical protein